MPLFSFVLDLDSEELCDGNPPMINPASDREYDCGNGRDTCPAGSYCHRVDGEARCCQEGNRHTSAGVLHAPPPTISHKPTY